MKIKIIFGAPIQYKNLGFKQEKEIGVLSEVIPIPYDLTSVKAGDKVLIPAYIKKTKEGVLQLAVKNIKVKDIVTKYYEKEFD